MEESFTFDQAEVLLDQPGERLVRARSASGKPCLIRAVLEPRPGTTGLRGELALAPRLSPEWAVVPRSLLYRAGVPHVVMDDAPGAPLTTALGEPWPLGRLLQVAERAAAALARFHESGLVHGALSPSRLLWDPASGVVRLMDFSSASQALEGFRSELSSLPFAGALTHMAPEQTGRLNRGVDQRADLYALGVTLYELATGALPCSATELLGWIHCHVAVLPARPATLVPALPEMVSAIVMKLLSKMPEERYQTAAGLQADLARCLAEFEASGHVQPFAMRADDVAATFRLPARLFGREEARAALMEAYEGVRAEGRGGLAFVSGPAGTGKTALVRELSLPVVRDRGFYAEGKFEAVGTGAPFSPIGRLVAALVEQARVLEPPRLAEIRRRAGEAVGTLGGLLSERFPAVERLLGARGPVPALPPREARALFLDVLRRFLDAFAEPGRPLVLFLDDLQWADADEVELLAAVARVPAAGPVLWVGGYRDGEVGPEHPLRAVLEASGARLVALRDLGPDDVAALVAGALGVDAGRARPLADALTASTGGNPLAVRQRLTALVEDGLISFDPAAGRWAWADEAPLLLATAGGYDALIRSKAERLVPLAREVVEAASVAGSAGEAVELARVVARPPAEVDGAFGDAARLGLVMRQGDRFRFVHDRVRQAVYAGIPGERRAGLHLAIAGQLVGPGEIAQAADELLFEAATHLNLAAIAIEGPERPRAVAVNLEAGRRATAAGAFRAATKYYEAGLAAQAACDGPADRQLGFELLLGGARAAWLTGDLEHALALLARARGLADAPAARLALETLEVHVSTTSGDWAGAVTAGLAGLAGAGLVLEARPGVEAVARAVEGVWRALGDRPIEALLDLPVATEPHELALLELMDALSAPVLFVDRNLYVLLHAEMTRRCIEHGQCGPAALAFVVFGMVLGSALGRFDEGARFGAVARALAERDAYLAYRATTLLTYGSMVGPWTRPLEHCIPIVEAGFEAAERTGDLTRACYCLAQIAWMRFANGEPLDALAKEALAARGYIRRARFEAIALTLDDLAGALAVLRHEVGTQAIATVGPASAAAAAELLPLGVSRGLILRLQLQVWFGEFAAARATAEQAALVLEASFAQVEVPTYHLFAGLAWAEGGRPADREALAGCLRALEPLAAASPFNFEAGRRLLAAEALRLDGQQLEALRGYDEAGRIAREAGQVPLVALAEETAARFLAAERLAPTAASYAAAANRHYGLWSAPAKQRELEARFPAVHAAAAPAAGDARLANVDAMAVARAATAIGRSIRRAEAAEAILQVLIERAGARRGALVRRQAGELRLEALASQVADRIEVDLTPAAGGSHLPWSIVTHVERSGLPVVLDDASRGAFSADPYVLLHRPRSVLCLPLIRQDGLAGFIYLENDLAAGAFSAADLDIYLVLATQAAITLENADLVEALKQREAELARANEALEARIRERTADLALANEALRRREASLAEAQQLAGLGSWEWDIETDRISWSDEIYRIFGVARGGFDGTYQAFLGLLHPDDLARTNEMVSSAVRERAPIAFEHRIIRPSGEVRTLSARGKVVLGAGGRPSRLVGTALDITERKALEARLLEQNARLRELDGLKTAFVSAVSHELRTPLTAIRGYGELLDDELAGPLTPGQREYVDQIRRAEIRLERLVDDLLDYARIEAGTFALQPEDGDLAAKVTEIVESFRPQAAESQVALLTELPPDGVPAHLDLPRIGQVLANLIGNALKFSPPGGGVQVALREEPAALLIEVADQGPGIAAEDMPRLFQRFSQLEAGRSKQRGTGLGLSICKALVEAHGGVIGVRSVPGAGATFWFRLPRP